MSEQQFIEGIDLSDAQGLINWKGVAAAGVRFAFVKATEGSTYVNPYYQGQLAGARAAGVLVAPYHFLSHDIDARLQAEHFLAVVDRAHNPDLLLPALDVEPDPSSRKALRNKQGGAVGTTWPAPYMVHLVDDVLTYIRLGLGVDIGIYSYQDWWKNYMADTHNYAQACPLWIASYPDPPRPPREPVSFGGWPYWTFWQWTASGYVGGVSVDRNRFKGSYQDLQKFANF